MVEIAAAEALYLYCWTSKKPIVIEKFNPGESIGYFGEMEVVTIRMSTEPKFKQVTEVMGPVEEVILMMEMEMEAN